MGSRKDFGIMTTRNVAVVSIRLYNTQKSLQTCRYVLALLVLLWVCFGGFAYYKYSLVSDQAEKCQLNETHLAASLVTTKRQLDETNLTITTLQTENELLKKKAENSAWKDAITIPMCLWTLASNARRFAKRNFPTCLGGTRYGAPVPVALGPPLHSDFGLPQN